MKKNPDNKGLPCCYKGMADEKTVKNTTTTTTNTEDRQEVVDSKGF